MKLAMRLATAGDETDDQVAFHRSAGVDEFVAPDAPTDADWVIDAEPGEFWWPRAESLKEVLAPIPPRYTIVQALVREFDGKQLTRRSTVEGMRAAGRTLLRPVRRRGFETRAVPLRAWYPLEVFRIEIGRAHV